jgi:hypothetical protein
MSIDILEQRVAALERDLRELKTKGQAQPFSKANRNHHWVEEVAGSMKDSPEFEELRQIMREMREAERAEFDRKNGNAQ